MTYECVKIFGGGVKICENQLISAGKCRILNYSFKSNDKLRQKGDVYKRQGLPVLMDGFISGVAALCAVRLCPAAEKAVFASHCSTEPAARLVLEALGKAPLLTAGLHLGEGTGAVASIPLWDMALAVYRDCYSFTEGGITPYTPQC